MTYHDINNEPRMVEQLKRFAEWKREAIANGDSELTAKLVAGHKLREWIANYKAKQHHGDAYEDAP